MSVGKESIKRAASAGAKKTASKAAEVKTEEVKTAEIKAEAPKTVKKPAVRKTAAKTTAAKTTGRVKASVLTPANSKEIQTKFISDKAKQPENTNVPVHISEELPVYLL